MARDCLIWQQSLHNSPKFPQIPKDFQNPQICTFRGWNPQGWSACLILPKSRHMGKFQIFPGVIDSNYSGPIVVGVMNTTTEDIVITAGQAIAQLTIQEITIPKLIQCEGIK